MIERLYRRGSVLGFGTWLGAFGFPSDVAVLRFRLLIESWHLGVSLGVDVTLARRIRFPSADTLDLVEWETFVRVECGTGVTEDVPRIVLPHFVEDADSFQLFVA